MAIAYLFMLRQPNCKEREYSVYSVGTERLQRRDERRPRETRLLGPRGAHTGG